MPNIEELLRKAMAEGKFDNLPGKGKPLQLDEANPHADPEWQLAYRMLKESGYSLPWIEEIREIEKELETARKALQIPWKWHQAALSQSRDESSISGEWKRAQDAFNEMLTSINKRIRNYNMQVPAARFQRPILNYDRELQKITSI